jgi:hypothetical protein
VIARVVAAATLLVLTDAASAAHGQGPTVPPAGGAGPTPTSASSSSSSSSAVAPDGRAARRPELVEITVVGGDPEYENLRLRIGAHLALGTPLVWSRIDRFNPLAELLRGVPPVRAATLRCWVDLTDPRRATLYFAGEGGDRFFVRELALSGRLDEIDQQSLAQVLELSITALTENQEIGFTREQARALLSRAQPPPSPPAPSPGRWSLAPAVGYTVSWPGASLPIAQGPGLTLALSEARGHGARLGIWIAGQYRWPTTARQPEIGMRSQTAAARAGVEAGWWRLRARLGGGADWTHVTPLPGDGGAGATLTVTRPHWSTSWVATGALAFRLPLETWLASPRLGLFVVLVIDLAPSALQYQVQDAGGARIVFAPARARPGAGLELAF